LRRNFEYWILEKAPGIIITIMAPLWLGSCGFLHVRHPRFAASAQGVSPLSLRKQTKVPRYEWEERQRRRRRRRRRKRWQHAAPSSSRRARCMYQCIILKVSPFKLPIREVGTSSGASSYVLVSVLTLLWPSCETKIPDDRMLHVSDSEVYRLYRGVSSDVSIPERHCLSGTQ
jgi:hypothetical protein